MILRMVARLPMTKQPCALSHTREKRVRHCYEFIIIIYKFIEHKRNSHMQKIAHICNIYKCIFISSGIYCNLIIIAEHLKAALLTLP